MMSMLGEQLSEVTQNEADGASAVAVIPCHAVSFDTRCDTGASPEHRTLDWVLS